MLHLSNSVQDPPESARSNPSTVQDNKNQVASPLASKSATTAATSETSGFRAYKSGPKTTSALKQPQFFEQGARAHLPFETFVGQAMCPSPAKSARPTTGSSNDLFNPDGQLDREKLKVAMFKFHLEKDQANKAQQHQM